MNRDRSRVGMQNTLNNTPPAQGNTRNLDREALFEKIRALGFVKVELELYLDTHPGCRVALDYYKQTVTALDELTADYEDRFGPLTAKGVTDSERWSWVDSPWPWHRADENMPNKWIGEGR